VTPVWSILIASLSRRRERVAALLAGLLPAAEAQQGRVEIIVAVNDGVPALGEIRQALLLAAAGEYVSFVDDDDQVAADFIPAILAELPGPDCVGFEVAWYEAGVRQVPCYCSIRYPAWRNDERALYRNLTHVQPVRAALARAGDFRASWPEDQAWVARVAPLLATETYLDRVMYHYRHDPADSVIAGHLPPHAHLPRPDIASPYLRWLELEAPCATC
jgi:hypothetical protein